MTSEKRCDWCNKVITGKIFACCECGDVMHSQCVYDVLCIGGEDQYFCWDCHYSDDSGQSDWCDANQIEYQIKYRRTRFAGLRRGVWDTPVFKYKRVIDSFVSDRQTKVCQYLTTWIIVDCDNPPENSTSTMTCGERIWVSTFSQVIFEIMYYHTSSIHAPRTR